MVGLRRLCYLVALAAFLCPVFSTALVVPGKTGFSVIPVVDRDYYGKLIELINGAEKQIDVLHLALFSECGRGRLVRQALAAACDRGLKVNILLEGGKGSVSRRNRITAVSLRRHGARVSMVKAQGRLLHAKMVLFDDNTALVGSTNLTNTSMTFNHEANVLIRSKTATRAMRRYFRRLAENPAVLHSHCRELEDGKTSLLFDRAFVEQAVKLIDSAGRSVKIATYLFDQGAGYSGVRKLCRALERAVKRGVDVQVLLEWSGYNRGLNKHAVTAAGRLKNMGIDSVRFDSPRVISHGKLIIVDGRRLVLGSSNWYARGADMSHQLNVKTADDLVVRRYSDYYSELFSRAGAVSH